MTEAQHAEQDDLDNDDPLVVEGDIAGDYLERLLDILDLDGDIDLDVEGSRAVVAVDGGDLQHLVGHKGQTLDALQELTRLAVTARTGVRSRLMLDIDGYRAGERDRLTKLATSAIADVRETGEERRLSPMNPFERKVVHDVVAAEDDVLSESTGEEPNRRVVIRRAS
ncbi:Jag family protein [Cumulibacter manganitolerans]|uniref:Jag family protein n=1 Tax=Cumulibacter manganitolerans TaxID=1884992 RepID=UPI0012977F9D|nr:R3H domain-containing nucleic acid-binding protein [Cumulibacter manganitolerans]